MEKQQFIVQGSAPKLTPATEAAIDEFAAELRRQVAEAVKKALAESEAATAAGGKGATANSAGEPVKARFPPRFPLPTRTDGKAPNVADAFALPKGDDDESTAKSKTGHTGGFLLPSGDAA